MQDSGANWCVCACVCVLGGVGGYVWVLALEPFEELISSGTIINENCTVPKSQCRNHDNYGN